MKQNLSRNFVIIEFFNILAKDITSEEWKDEFRELITNQREIKLDESRLSMKNELGEGLFFLLNCVLIKCLFFPLPLGVPYHKWLCYVYI